MLKFVDAIEKYKNYMEAFNRSPATTYAHIAAAERLYHWSRCENYEDITPDMIIDYIKYLREAGAGGNSINTYIAWLKAFSKTLVKRKWTKNDLADCWERFGTKTAQKMKGKYQSKYVGDERKFIPLEDRQKIFAAADAMPRGKRQRILVETPFVCGLRVSEVCSLKVSDFDFKTGKLTVRGKGDKLRSFYVGSNDYLAKISDYIKENELKDDDFLFQTSRGKPMMVRQYENLFQRILRRAGVPCGRKNGGYTTHDCRGTHITARLETGEPIKIISLDVGHSSVSQTEKYYRNNDNDQKRINKTGFMKKAGLVPTTVPTAEPAPDDAYDA